MGVISALYVWTSGMRGGEGQRPYLTEIEYCNVDVDELRSSRWLFRVSVSTPRRKWSRSRGGSTMFGWRNPHGRPPSGSETRRDPTYPLNIPSW